MEVEATSLIGISTPRDDDDGSYYSDIVKRCTPEGKLIFNVERIQGSCEKCAIELDDPLKCPHVRLITPAHKSADKQRSVMALYGDQKDVMARESLGIATSGVNGKFAKYAIENLFKSERVSVERLQGPLYIAINPNGGQTGYTVATGCYVGSRLIIVGMDMTHVTNFIEAQQFLLTHLNSVREMFKHCGDQLKMILIPESSLGHEAAQIMLATKHLPGISCCSETKKGTKWGVPMHDICALADHMERVLDPAPVDSVPVTESYIGISNPIASKTPDKCITQLEKQLKAWRPVYTSSTDVRKLRYSGRVDGDGRIRKHLTDDLCIALQLLAYWSTAIRQRRMAHFNYRIFAT